MLTSVPPGSWRIIGGKKCLLNECMKAGTSEYKTESLTSKFFESYCKTRLSYIKQLKNSTRQNIIKF